MQVERHHARCAGCFEHVGNHSSSDGFATLGLAVLAGVSVKGAHCCDALGRSALRCINHDELFHDGIVNRSGIGSVMRLHDEHVATTNTVGETWSNFSVSKLHKVGITQVDIEMIGNFLGKRRMGAPGKKRQALGGHFFHRTRVHEETV